MVKKVNFDELHSAAELASCVWNCSKEKLYEEFKASINKKGVVFFLAYAASIPVGFAQCKLRYDYVEGTKTSPVGYLEGIFVKEEYRKKGYAKELLAACEQWAKAQGCSEFASDCELDNSESLIFHLKNGFNEANRIVCFKKVL